MRIRPTGLELLSTARTVLRDRVMPHVGPDQQAAVCEIERVMAIAANALQFEQRLPRADVEALEAARIALRQKLLGQLPQDCQYDARLVVKAMAIATSELRSGADPERAELARLTTVLDAVPQSAASASDVHYQLELLYARLCSEIRAGRLDPGSSAHAAVYGHLHAATRQALSESNPAYVLSRTQAVHETLL
jgi:hypothetical protein